ncbi:MAG: hypothetical protein AAF960_22585 [Bacteroidota bacterium]
MVSRLEMTIRSSPDEQLLNAYSKNIEDTVIFIHSFINKMDYQK